MGEMLFDVGNHPVHPRNDPAVEKVGLRNGLHWLAFCLHQYKTGCVPELVAEIAVAFYPAKIESDIPAGRGQSRESKAQRVRAERRYSIGKFLAGQLFDRRGHPGLHQADGPLPDQLFQLDPVDQVDWIQHIALGLGHFLAVPIPDQAVYVNGPERNIVHEFQPHHDHPGDPEENDIEAGDQHSAGVKPLEVIRLLWPAQCGKRPQGRGEPGVEHIFVLSQTDVVGQA